MIDSTGSGKSVGGTTLLLILFIALKLTHVINWSWWWVLSPLWVSAMLAIMVLGVLAAIAISAERSR